MSQQLPITTSYITLGQLLKEVGVIDTGGMAKWYLAEHEVLVNGESEDRRGKKLFSGDSVTLADGTVIDLVDAE
ncbi:S4 domain-containing protein YaaA [Halalkalibacterium halodurans]|jgi:S4 domain protein YaaA|uniref:BH0003 protein n=2 Tax=Halalkalibacterium halodurans TaxID=86665 RepID=Q7AJZ9_HALH5|nr:S4 domain-containing protein YaaA [Halalkalibacterium halodurans]MDY7224584.1 S4 domain-containing protein YaaA [Halalkalibacterium halodurans]MDY7239746.1 S4 domain-containing protein YaaA [Halalkalibacterium halodurans]MED3647661.1 S4 domain-containing protein YaaA [Halalkalibacterium halodurans]MED4081027.1 S4 domain-containing protein YaaA [Halalkalibacterium halodurans]MED4084909.1 S4 domain-containing protein YaaA [Halalkalibacterium halodurans]